jgi:UDP-GlcNAc3NAcA epimerase
MDVIVSLHPRTRMALEDFGISTEFRPIPPVGYFDMIEMLKNARIVLTDSGGLQKEAFFFGKPCVTFREETEWTELVDGGFNGLAGRTGRRLSTSGRRCWRRSGISPSIFTVGAGRPGGPWKRSSGSGKTRRQFPTL